jgi:hypothetical protein
LFRLLGAFFASTKPSRLQLYKGLFIISEVVEGRQCALLCDLVCDLTEGGAARPQLFQRLISLALTLSSKRENKNIKLYKIEWKFITQMGTFWVNFKSPFLF